MAKDLIIRPGEQLPANAENPRSGSGGFLSRWRSEQEAAIARNRSVAANAELIRTQAEQERFYLEATQGMRMAARAEAEGLEHQVKVAQLSAQLEEARFASRGRQRAEVEARQAHELAMRHYAQQLEEREDEGISLEEAEELLRLLKEHIANLKAELIQASEGDALSGDWESVDELAEELSHFEARHKELFKQYLDAKFSMVRK